MQRPEQKMPPQPVHRSPPMPSGAVTRTLQMPPVQNHSSDETCSPFVAAKLIPVQSASSEQLFVQIVPWFDAWLQSLQLTLSQDSPPTASRQVLPGQSPAKDVSQNAPRESVAESPPESPHALVATMPIRERAKYCRRMAPVYTASRGP